MPSHLWAPHRPSSLLLRTFQNLPNGAVLEVLCKCRKNIQNEPFDFTSICAIVQFIHLLYISFYLLSIVHVEYLNMYLWKPWTKLHMEPMGKMLETATCLASIDGMTPLSPCFVILLLSRPSTSSSIFIASASLEAFAFSSYPFFRLGFFNDDKKNLCKKVF